MSKDHLQARGALTARAALASVAMATALVAAKAYAAWTTDSVAMLGSLADTGFDLLASLITLFAVRLAAVPADNNHRFGHGKAEALAALIQVGLIMVSAAGIAWRAVERLRNGAPTEAAEPDSAPPPPPDRDGLQTPKNAIAPSDVRSTA